MSTHVIGFRPPDERWLQMKKIWESCINAGIDPPAEVESFFGEDGGPDPAGVVIDLDNTGCITEYSDADLCQDGIEIDVRKLPKDIYILRFINSY
jgi:hypothetical protein